MEERISFETLVSEISSRFVSVPSIEVDQEIEETQRLNPESLPSGQQPTEEELGYMVDEYYRLRGWDQKAVPMSEKPHVS
ncbi:MAG: aldehyde ferredoxin oxidoreductase C-terminal domain-containing protein [Deltaproteobacteria bacterium]